MLGGLVVVALVAGLVIGGLLRGQGAPRPTTRSTGPGGTAQGARASPRPRRPSRRPSRPPVTRSMATSVLGDGRPEITASRRDRPDDARPLLGDEQARRRDRHDPEGYQAIVGPLGEQLIREAHDRGVRVELVFSSFGTARNKRLFSVSNSRRPRRSSIDALVTWPVSSRSTGSTSTSRSSTTELIDAYGGSSATSGRRCSRPIRRARCRSPRPPTCAVGDGPGRLDGRRRPDLPHGLRLPLVGLRARRLVPDRPPRRRREGPVWSLDMYAALGVPVERTILGLPLYGMAWPVVGPELGAAADRQGVELDPERPSRLPRRPGERGDLDEIEQVDQYVIAPTGADGGAARPSARPSASPLVYTAIYVDSPATLTPKIAIADHAAWPVWASGRSATNAACPTTRALIKRFREGKLDRSRPHGPAAGRRAQRPGDSPGVRSRPPGRTRPATEPVQDVAPVRVALGTRGWSKSSAGSRCMPDPFHHRDRRDVPRRRPRQDLAQRHVLEAEPERRPARPPWRSRGPTRTDRTASRPRRTG